jgi:SAM-dependent methyltransferase
MNVPTAQFLHEYARQRAHEGRTLRGDDLRSLPYLRSGPLARQWSVRARSYEAFVACIVEPMGRQCLRVLDLGAGNGWLCHRLARSGHRAIALDVRDDDVDGLGAAMDLLTDSPDQFQRVKASFGSLPFPDHAFDIALFNAALHYSTDLAGDLTEAKRVTRPNGTIAILDSPFYANERDGERMIAEKLANGATQFGRRAEVLLSQNFTEFLTRDRLQAANPILSWSHHRIRYPLWYELRPVMAWLRGSRRPSRFDLWSARVP